MELKYNKEIAPFNCDLSGFKEIKIEAFRWTFSDINDSRNFEPVYINDPKRKQDSCLGYALSFYTSKEAGLRRHKDLTSNKPSLFKKLGSHIASGVLDKIDGISGSPNTSKHFDFFTYKNVELKLKFTILESIS